MPTRMILIQALRKPLASIERMVAARWVTSNIKPLPPHAGDRPDIGGSCRLGKGQVCPGDSVKSMPEPGTERAIVDCAADLEQQISAIS